MAALAQLEDIANGRVLKECFQRSHWPAGTRWWLAYQPSQIAQSHPFFLALRWTAPAWRRETDRCPALPVPAEVLTTMGFVATRAFQRETGHFTFIPVPRHASRMGRPYPYDAQISNLSQRCGWTGKHSISSCNQSDGLQSHCCKGTIRERICFCEQKTFSVHKCATDLWCADVSHKWGGTLAWFNSWIIHPASG